MNQIELHINELNSEFLIKGETKELLANRRARYFLFNTLGAQLTGNNIISISYADGDRESTLNSIQQALEGYGIQMFDSSEIKQVLNQYYTERENFKAFSDKAKRIWSNDVNIRDFSDFKNSIQKNLPNRILYDKQLLAAFHLAFAQNACNFSVPGTGKTSVVYAAYSYLKNLPSDHPKRVNKLLIIGPLSSFGPWEDEYKECFGKEPLSKRLSGGVSPLERERYLLTVAPINEVPEITLLSYQSVAYNLENLSHFLERADSKVMVVLDEAHKIKNVEGGKWASAVLSLSKLRSVRSRVVLTGTPVPNGYEDMFNLYEFIWPGKDIIDFNISQLREMSNNKFDSRIEQLVSNISPFFIRIRKWDVLDPNKYPIKNNDPTYIKMGKVQKEIYQAIENKYIDYFEEHQSTLNLTAQLAKARFIRLMQAASNPNLLKQSLDRYFQDEGLGNELYIDDREVIDKILRYKELEPMPPKFVALKDMVKSILDKGEKVIIWATFIQNINEIQSYLKENGISTEKLIGEVPVETDDIAEDVVTREKIIKEFHQPHSRFKVIIANPFAVAESISLHKACHNAIYFERTFNAANFIQSKDRIHRVGLEENTLTQYHYLLSSESIDETIHSRLIEKENRMVELIESQEIPLISQNMNYDIDLSDDVKAMIRDYVRRTAKV